MILKEEFRDLFNVSEEYYLAQCISSDFAMGAGIAIQFNKHFNIKNKLVNTYGNYISAWDSGFEETIPCIKEGRVFNLITKRNYWNKPTYVSMENALIALKCLCLNNGVSKIAIPKLGCGIDKLNWLLVKKQIFYIFEDTDIEILICIR